MEEVPKRKPSELGHDATQEDASKKARPSPNEPVESRRIDAIDADLLLVYDEALIPSKPQRQLAEAGVRDVKDVLARRNAFKEGTVGEVYKPSQKSLFHFCLWHADFYTKNDQATSWIEHFEEKAFEKFVDSIGLCDAKTKMLFEQAVRMLHEGSPGQLGMLPPEAYDELYAHVVHLVRKQLPEHLIEGCKFDVDDLITSCARAICNFPTGKPFPIIQLVAGRTQSGKSNVKAVVKATCEALYCPLLIIAKGVAEREDLKKKLDHLLNQFESAFKSWYGASSNKRSMVINDTAAAVKKKAIRYVQELRALKPHGKFVVIVDECDAAYRTDEGSQEFEKAFNSLMDLMPALRIEISATPIPAWLVLSARGLEVDIMQLGTSEDYAGVTNMKPLEDDKGDSIFLSPKDISHDFGYMRIGPRRVPNMTQDDFKLLFPLSDFRQGHASEREAREFARREGERLDFIPYTNDSVMRLYDNAMSKPSDGKKEGVLLLDCTANRVKVECNIFQKAAGVQDHFCAQGKRLVVVVFVGDGIFFRRPGFLHGRYVPNQKRIADVINRLDEEYGLQIPIFVFGWTKMRRCISYRSDRRVPTHMVLLLGQNQSDESYIQALGRATFNGLETVLAKNGHSHITVLTSKNDFAMAKKHQNFVQDISTRVKAGENRQDIISAAKQEILFNDSSNYKRHSDRKTGQVKGLKMLLPDQSTFEVPDQLDSDDEFLDETFDKDDTDHGKRSSTDKILKQVMRAIYDLLHEGDAPTKDDITVDATGNDDEEQERDQKVDNFEATLQTTNRAGFSAREIMDQYNDTFHDDGFHTVVQADLNKALTYLKNRAILEQTDETKRWRAKNVRIFMMQCVKGGIDVDDDNNADDTSEETNQDLADAKDEELRLVDVEFSSSEQTA